jgi:hypothetical protein
MAWRQIKVDGDVYRWTVGVTRAPRITGELESIRLTVIARGVSVEKRVSATFHGWVVEDLWNGRQQALMVTPAIVADIIRRSAVLGPAIDHAEAIFAAAVGNADPRDVALSASCAQWFVPYPGRAALQEALRLTGRSFAAVAERFSSPSVRLTAAQVAGWVHKLGL